MSTPEISFKVVEDETHYSCGCRQKVVGENFFFVPCSLSCEVYMYALEESRKRGNEISVTVVEDLR